MKLVPCLSQNDVVSSIIERVQNKYPDPKGLCQFIARDLMDELTSKGINSKHVVGYFHLDEPGVYEFIGLKTKVVDEYMVDHDWIELEGKILDLSAIQFQKYVYEQIPKVVHIGYSHPLFVKYEPLKYV